MRRGAFKKAMTDLAFSEAYQYLERKKFIDDDKTFCDLLRIYMNFYAEKWPNTENLDLLLEAFLGSGSDPITIEQ